MSRQRLLRQAAAVPSRSAANTPGFFSRGGRSDGAGAAEAAGSFSGAGAAEAAGAFSDAAVSAAPSDGSGRLPPAEIACTIIRPADCHCFRNLPENPYRDYLQKDIYVNAARFAAVCDFLRPGLYNEIMEKPTAPVFRLPDECIAMQRRKLDLFATETDPLFLSALHTSVVSELLSFYLYDDMLAKKNLPPWLTNLLYDLDDPEIMTLSVTELAARVGYSLEHLSREFRKYMNKTLTQYLTERKINYSVALLKSRRMKIIDIANMLGYENPSTFTLHFKAAYRCTPREYLKALYAGRRRKRPARLRARPRGGKYRAAVFFFARQSAAHGFDEGAVPAKATAAKALARDVPNKPLTGPAAGVSADAAQTIRPMGGRVLPPESFSLPRKYFKM